MKTKFQKLILIVLLSLGTGCGSSSSDDSKKPGANGGQSTNPVAWESVPAQFNPNIEESIFKIDRIEKIEMDLFEFSDDVRVSYSNQLAADEGQLKIYKVHKNSASFGNLSISRADKKVSLKRYGEFNCSIQIKNGQIQQLDGGCFVRVEVLLPSNAEVEVYNVKNLLTKRFFAIDNVTFLKSLKDASWDDDKLAVVEHYLDSYKTVGKSPVIKSAELKTVLERFTKDENQFTILQQLHSYVTDRDQLKSVIDKVFPYFDREKAYKICGI